MQQAVSRVDLDASHTCNWALDEEAPLACPNCFSGSLGHELSFLHCRSCSRAYPFVGSVPCLVPDPPLWRALWMSRAEEFRAFMDARVFFARKAREQSGSLPATKRRLDRLIEGLEEQKTKTLSLLRPLIAEMHLFLPSRPEDAELPRALECYENIFRDWAWGSAEVDRATEILERELPPDLSTVAILGAGAGRLARDLHQRVAPARTFALDRNPLPLLVADALVRGETVELPELPVAPHVDREVVVPHCLQFRQDTREGLFWLLADAMRPPFASSSLDVVVTSWFIDATGTDLRYIANAIHRVLRPGGVWLNLGPLRFRGELSGQYTIGEVLDVVRASSFELASSSRHDLPYFDSPFSGSRRTETVFFFAAEKTAETDLLPAPRGALPWVDDPRLPIPVSPPLAALARTSAFTAAMLGLVDGSRSMTDIAGELGRSWQVEPSLLLDQLRAFFAKLPA